MASSAPGTKRAVLLFAASGMAGLLGVVSAAWNAIAGPWIGRIAPSWVAWTLLALCPLLASAGVALYARSRAA